MMSLVLDRQPQSQGCWSLSDIVSQSGFHDPEDNITHSIGFQLERLAEQGMAEGFKPLWPFSVAQASFSPGPWFIMSSVITTSTSMSKNIDTTSHRTSKLSKNAAFIGLGVAIAVVLCRLSHEDA